LPTPTYDICALGNAIVDIVADVTGEFLIQQHIPKDTMMLVDATRITLLRKSLKGARAIRAGGAAGNTVAGIASFGGKAAYMGRIAFDEVGHLFNDDLKKLGVHFTTLPATHEGAATGLCISFVSPDAHRTMVTCLGSSIEFGAGDIDEQSIRAANLTYLEGFMLDRTATKAALHAAAGMARAARRKVALALCDPACVERNRAAFLELVNGKIDIVFANEKELMMLYKTFDLDVAIKEVKAHVNTAVVTRSEKGAVIVTSSRHFAVAAEPVAHVVDKTGAGDAFAAGFIFGLARGFDLTLCARLGAIAAAEVISHYGPRPEQSLAGLARRAGALL
jgi:sugar/nucleoside kinase (ribokinase family)